VTHHFGALAGALPWGTEPDAGLEDDAEPEPLPQPRLLATTRMTPLKTHALMLHSDNELRDKGVRLKKS
jgi:hypothetical protein